MSRRKRKELRLLLLSAAIVSAAGAVLFVLPVAADGAVLGSFTVLAPSASQGSVQVSGTNDGKTTISISDASASFGRIDPAGSEPDSDDGVESLQGTQEDQGSYYVWKSDPGAGLRVVVKSNRSWSGTVRAAENSGTASTMSIASGALRYVEGAPPVSYDDCASAAAFATAEAPWRTEVSAGVHSFVHYYCLRSDWSDEPGSFRSSVIYTVSQ
jgi:hypothetical protein